MLPAVCIVAWIDIMYVWNVCMPRNGTNYSCLAGARRPHYYLDPLGCLLSEISLFGFGRAIGQVDVVRLETVFGT